MEIGYLRNLLEGFNPEDEVRVRVTYNCFPHWQVEASSISVYINLDHGEFILDMIIDETPLDATQVCIDDDIGINNNNNTTELTF